MVARPVRDVIRQAWQQWSYSQDSRADEVLSAVLALNHLPNLESYMQNYFLLHTPGHATGADPQEFTVAPLSALVLHGFPDRASGGVRLSFTPDGDERYATAVLYFTPGEKGGTLAMKKGQSGPSAALIPYAGMEHYRLVIVNPEATWLKGTVMAEFDSTIPGVVDYFRVNSAEDGVQIEWKTSRENGVAFWNLYRMSGGRRELLNDFPIPAAIHSSEGLNYLYLDSSDSSFYSLEAITSEGFASPLASAEAVP
jgi:hypothetical protein